VIDGSVSAAQTGSASAVDDDDDPSSVWITFTNTLGWSRYEVAVVTSGTADVIITDPSGQPVPHDVLPADQPHNQTKPDADSGDQHPRYDLVFPVQVPAVGFAVYRIRMNPAARKGQSTSSAEPMGNIASVYSNTRTAPRKIIPGIKPRAKDRRSLFKTKPLSGSADLVIENDLLQLTISADTGRIAKLLDKRVPQSEPVANLSLTSNYFNYSGDHPFEGAYIFSPNAAPHLITPADATVNVTVEQGKFITRVTQVWSPTVKTMITVFQCHPACSPSSQPALPPSALCTQCGMVHVTSVIGPLHNVTQDIVLRYSMNTVAAGAQRSSPYFDPMASSLLHTVENGLQSIARPHRRSYEEVVSGNYFPMPTAGYLRSAQTPNSTYA